MPSLEKLKEEKYKLKREIQELKAEKGSLIAEVRRFIPAGFYEAYSLLVAQGQKVTLGSPLAGVDEVSMTGAGMQQIKDTFVTSTGGLRDERARKYREGVDRKLRGLGREIVGYLSSEGGLREVRCQRCSKFCESGWKHCAWCGEGLVQPGRAVEAAS